MSDAFADRIKAVADQIRSMRINAHCIGDAIEAKIDAERALRRIERDMRSPERGRAVR